jgi:hypothetical protein
MVYVALPWLSQRTGRRWAGAIEPFIPMGEPSPEPPLGTVIVRTRWPSARVIYSIPGGITGTACYEELSQAERPKQIGRWYRWVERFLSEVLVSPALRPEETYKLGPDFDVLSSACLRVWNWSPDDLGEWTYMPHKGMVDMLRYMAKQTRRLPSELLDMPLPLFGLNIQILKPRKDDAAEAFIPHGD